MPAKVDVHRLVSYTGLVVGIHFLDFPTYSIQIEGGNYSENLIVYQFDKYLLLATSLYVKHNYLFGLIKRYTYEGGPEEESNIHDIFRNREHLDLIVNGITYHYSSSSIYKEFLMLRIEKEK